MDSFELNKVLGAILGTCLGVLAINIAAGAIFAPTIPAKPGYEIAVPEQKPGEHGKPAEQQQQHSLQKILHGTTPCTMLRIFPQIRLKSNGSIKV